MNHLSAGGGNIRGYIYDLEIYDGISSVVSTTQRPTDVQVGSRWEETDTRKIYYRDDIDFKELDGAEATNYRSDSWYEQLSGETP
jgi:hypothetical protein